MRSVLKAMTVIAMSVIACSLSASAQTITVSAQSTLSAFSLNSNPTSTQVLDLFVRWKINNLSTVDTCISMTQPMRGTGNNTDTLSASNVYVNGAPLTGAGCLLPNAVVVAHEVNARNKDNDHYYPQIQIRNFPSNLQADTYTGTLTITVYAY